MEHSFLSQDGFQSLNETYLEINLGYELKRMLHEHLAQLTCYLSVVHNTPVTLSVF